MYVLYISILGMVCMGTCRHGTPNRGDGGLAARCRRNLADNPTHEQMLLSFELTPYSYTLLSA